MESTKHIHFSTNFVYSFFCSEQKRSTVRSVCANIWFPSCFSSVSHWLKLLFCFLNRQSTALAKLIDSSISTGVFPPRKMDGENQLESYRKRLVALWKRGDTIWRFRHLPCSAAEGQQHRQPWTPWPCCGLVALGPPFFWGAGNNFTVAMTML